MDGIEIQKHFFRPICNEQEIEQIFNVQNSDDLLLKIRAETIVDHMRLFRVYRAKALRAGKEWSLENSFSSEHYLRFLNQLPPEERMQCENVAYGNVFSNEPNGMIFATQYTPIITISESLTYFLKFAHLAMLDFEEDIPAHIKVNALRIAIRVMLKSEAMDFYLDPRGIIPKSIAEKIHAPIPLQMQFIAGHEFSHHILGHLSNHNIVEQPIFHAISTHDTEYKPSKVYNPSQQDEFEADIQAILLPQYDDHQRTCILEAALLWFGCLDLYEAVSDYMFPKPLSSYQSHPSARERFENLLVKIPTTDELDIQKWKQHAKYIDGIKKQILEDVALNCDAYEFYGSIYLDEPNTIWRGPELVDRKDF